VPADIGHCPETFDVNRFSEEVFSDQANPTTVTATTVAATRNPNRCDVMGLSG